ncbi:hypothetical protein [Roseovarius sp. 2305UL8-3]|uniref:hypothetical protein n=1 Tax=Roseovarius conchicola TaxID=3121636 RepID=UPI0035287F99
MRFARFLGATLICAGCGNGEASHLPANPLLLPVYGASAALENASYNAKRRKVEKHVINHHTALLGEIETQPGPALAQAYLLADVPAPVQAVLLDRLREDIAQYRASPEALVVALMVHGNS